MERIDAAVKIDRLKNRQPGAGAQAGHGFARTVLAAAATAIGVLAVLNLSLGDKQIDARLAPRYALADPQFLRAMGSVLGPPLVHGNRVEALVNGDETFAAMLSAIAGARKSITLETYIFWSGSIGHEFADALAARAAEGVKVHVLLDWIGGELDPTLLERMQRGGVAIRRYNRPRWHNLDHLNNRTHRKLLVIDGAVGFTGGVGIADPWRGDAQDAAHWRDTHFRLEGPAVAQMQSTFIDNWMQASGEVLHGEDYLPALAAAGESLSQVFTSSPGGGAESMQLMYLMSIAAARESIRISASYFVPDDVTVNALVAARRRGVRVQIIVPGPHIDWALVRHASRASWGRLLEAGAEIYEYQPTMYHVKVFIADALWVSVGSTNFDNRSFAINDEANLNVYDAAFALRQLELFRGDLARSRRVTYDQWRSRPWHRKLADFAASLLSSQL